MHYSLTNNIENGFKFKIIFNNSIGYSRQNKQPDSWKVVLNRTIFKDELLTKETTERLGVILHSTLDLIECLYKVGSD